MPYYIAPIIAGPTRRRATRIPAGSDSQAGANWIVLSKDLALLWLPSAIVDARLTKLADGNSERLAAATRTALTALSDDRPYRAADNFDATIFGLLRNAPAGKWASLRPSFVRQRYEVWLGPGGPGRNLLGSEPAVLAPHSKTYVDTFNRSDGALDGSTSSDGLFVWDETQGAAPASIQIASNQASLSLAGATNVWIVIRANADCDTDDDYCQVDLKTFTRNSGHLAVGVGVRGDGWGGGGDGYYFEVGNNNGTAYRDLRKFDDDTSLGSDSTSTTSGILRIEADGSSITAKVAGSTVIGPVTNTSFAGLKKTALTWYSSDANNALIVDDAEAGDLAGGGGTPYSEAGIGGVALGGSGTIVAAYAPAASGGGSLAGSGTPAARHAPSASGGAVVQGSGAPDQTNFATASAGPALAGAGDPSARYAPNASGGAVVAGAGAPALIAALAATGGVNIVGAGSPVTAAQILATGVVAIAGGAGSPVLAVAPAASGGAVLGGSGTATTSAGVTASGGVAIEGAGGVMAAFAITSSGGVVIAGAGSLGNEEYSDTGSGGAAVGGSGTASLAAALTASGGVVLAGAGTATLGAAVMGSGGVVIAGAGGIVVHYLVAGSGGVIVAGTGGVGAGEPIVLVATTMRVRPSRPLRCLARSASLVEVVARPSPALEVSV